MKRHPFIFWGGVFGLLLPLFLLGLQVLLAALKFPFGTEQPSELITMGLVACEVPAVLIGRALRLPIEEGTAFIFYQLNLLGYALVVVFWAVAGALVGGLIGLMRNIRRKKIRPRFERK